MSNEFGFLGMDFDEIRRKTERTDANGATWEHALAAASRFSGGRPCSRGKGTKPESENSRTESRREGSFNVCYWVNVEGMDTQWVVRFPKQIADLTVIQMKLRSEVATLQFLHQNTRVPVPKVIGYSEGKDELPPFSITENVDGIRLSMLWAFNVGPSIVTTILRSLAEVQHELLSYPFARIGMLELSTTTTPGSILLGPFSLDSFEHCRDGVSPTLYPPFENAGEYYDHKLEIWNRRLREQRNSVDSRTDALRKFMNANIIQEFLRHSGGPLEGSGPFYLFHPDMGSNNVIIDSQTWKIKAIIDWEGTCTLPIESALSPPKCLHNIKPIDMFPNSNNFQRFQERLELYSRQFSYVVRISPDANQAVGHERRRVTKRKDWHMPTSLTPRVFFTWAIDDVRDLDQLVWQHIAPALYGELRQQYNAAVSQQPEDKSGDASHDAILTLLSNFVDKLYRSGHYETETIEFWVSKKLKDLEAYRRDYNKVESSGNHSLAWS